MVDIHQKNAGSLSFEQLYRASYKIVLRKKGEKLYDRVREFEETWFRENVMGNIVSMINMNLISIALRRRPESSVTEQRGVGEKFLRGIRDSWDDHNMSMNMITDIMMYLDRAWTTETCKPGIFAATIGLFRDHVLRCSVSSTLGPEVAELEREFQVFDIISKVILDLINMERDGDVIDRNLVHCIIVMLEHLYETDEEVENQRLYLTVFEPLFISASQHFYREECQKLLRNTDAGSWLRHTQRRLQEEHDRCGTTLSLFTTEKIAKVVEQELIREHLDEFLAMEGSGLRTMIDNDRVDDLAILYSLILRVDTTKAALKQGLQTRVRELGDEIEKVLRETDFSTADAEAEEAVAGDGAEKAKPRPAAAQQTQAAIKWVDDVLALKQKFDNLLRTSFDEDLVLQSAITRSFSDFINAFDRSSEYVSLYIDDNLKRGIKGKSESEVDKILERAIVLVRYLSDRDMFERYYQKHLARRLLHGKSESQDVEKEMISRMKQEAGNHFTTKFEGMFKDMELSRDLTKNYREHIRNLGDADTTKLTELNISVLTTNNWPPEVMGRGQQHDEAKVQCIYPPEIKRLQDSFFSYYLKDRSGRILTWVGSAGTADIKCLFPKIPGKESGPLSRSRRYELTVTTYGMMVLLLFNDDASAAPAKGLLFDEIQERTGIPVPELTRTLLSLSAAPKSRVLLKDPPTRSVRPGDRFAFNAAFASKTIKIKAPTVNPVSKVEGDEDRRETERKNDQTRAYVVDAAIVRIMKCVHTDIPSTPSPFSPARDQALFPPLLRRDTSRSKTDGSGRTNDPSATPQVPEAPRPQRPHGTGHRPPRRPLQARGRPHQEAHRGPPRARVPRAPGRRPDRVRIPGIVTGRGGGAWRGPAGGRPGGGRQDDDAQLRRTGRTDGGLGTAAGLLCSGGRGTHSGGFDVRGTRPARVGIHLQWGAAAGWVFGGGATWHGIVI